MGVGDHEDYNSSVLTAWNDMIVGAVDSDAQCHGLAVIEEGNYWYWSELSVYIDRYGATDSYAGGKGSPGEKLNGFDPVASWQKWSEKIPALWTDWEDNLPDPESYEPLRTLFYDAAAQLALNPQQSKYGTSADDQQAAFSSALHVLTGEIGSMDGAAMIAFNHEIASRIPYTSKAQAAACLVAAYAVQAEQAVWKTARTNLGKTIEDAKTAFKQAYPGGGDSSDLGWLSMVSEISGALAIVPGPQQAVLGTVASVAGGLVTIDKYLGSNVTPSPLRADSPDAVCTNVTNALNDLNESIVKGEHAIGQGCTSMKNTAHGDPYVYDLSKSSRPGALGEDNPRDFLKIDVEYDKLKDIAEVTLPAIAHAFDVARSHLSGGQNAGYWDRPAGIGQNPFGEFSGLVGELEALLSSTAWKVRASAQHMEWVVRDFKKTDDWQAAAQRDLTKDTNTVTYTGAKP